MDRFTNHNCCVLGETDGDSTLQIEKGRKDLFRPPISVDPAARMVLTARSLSPLLLVLLVVAAASPASASESDHTVRF
ncbi:hypothetical protein BHM03_00032003 [Ensete ventricosum]|nr:hypothetical protein BHM03_00032003 [Ensete ventricosum]